MQKFPKDSRDDIEIKYAKHVLSLFPSYKIFWEKFVGVDVNKADSILPREPKFLGQPTNRQIKNIKNFQLYLSKINYSLFCNLISSCDQYTQYMKSLPPINDHFLYWTMESYECAYFHIGNIIFELREIWKKLKEKNIVPTQYINKHLSDFLGNKSGNWDKLHDEPRKFRNCLVHNYKYICAIGTELYFPDKTDPSKIMWEDMNFNHFIKGSTKLKSHIDLAYNSCEDIYVEIIPLIDNYFKQQRVII